MTAFNSKMKYKKTPRRGSRCQKYHLIISRCGYATDWKVFGLVIVSLTCLSSLMSERPYVIKVTKQHGECSHLRHADVTTSARARAVVGSDTKNRTLSESLNAILLRNGTCSSLTNIRTNVRTNVTCEKI